MSLFRHKSLVWILLVVCLTAAFGVGGSYAKGELYHCPMHPQVVSDKPGDCPICHMRLVLSDPSAKMASDGTPRVDGRLPVRIDPEAGKAVGIRTEVVKMMPLKKTLRGWGMAAHDPELFEMQIEFLRQERLGYERERDRTPVALKRGLTEREKIRFRFLEKGLSEDWVKDLEEAGIPDKRLIYHHEASGSWVYVQLREKDAALVKPGDAVSISVPALPELVLQGTVKFVDGLVDEETFTVRVRVLVEDAPPSFKPNTSVTASITIDLGDSTVVSENAPLFTGKRALVFVEETGTFKPREVVLGNRADGYYQVLSGLMAGEVVASQGNFFLDSESRLQASLAGSSHEGHSS